MCPLDCRKPAAILILISCILSISTLVVFASGGYSTLDEFSQGHTLDKILAWPYYVRLLATLLQAAAAILTIVHEYKARSGYMITETDEDKLIVVPVNDEDLMDEFPEFGEPL